MAQTVKKKKAVSGFIQPRWPKEKVTFWLELGAIPAILGLWFPDWLGSFAKDASFVIPPQLPAFPPILTYIGAVILLKACYEGIRNMGYHFKGLKISGGLSVLFAIASVVVQLVDLWILSLFFTGLAAFFAAGFFWFTIGKIWEITQETRTKITWWVVLISAILALLVYGIGLLFLLANQLNIGFLLLRLGVAVLTVTFLFCRYGVYIYKTQTSIGARFKESPDEQYWTNTNS